MNAIRDHMIQSLTSLSYNFTRHTLLIALLTLLVLTALQGWIVALPWETDNPNLIGVGVGLSEVGCLIGATILSIFPTHRRLVHLVLFAVGGLGSVLGIFAIKTIPNSPNIVHETILLIAFTLIGIATSIQPITVIVPVKDPIQTAVNANLYSMCRQLSYATTLLFAMFYLFCGWRAMCVLSIIFFMVGSVLTYLVEKWSHQLDIVLDAGDTPTPFKEAVRTLPKFVWVILLAFSASGFTEGVNNSMSVLVLKQVWASAQDIAFTRTMTCPLIAVCVYPFIAMYLTHRWQFLLAMFLLGLFIILYSLMPNAWLGFIMLIFWNIGKTCMHSSIYSVIREATDDGSVIARLVALEQWTATLFYGFAGVIGGPLYNIAFWVPFLVAGVIQGLLLAASFMAFALNESTKGEATWKNFLAAINKPLQKSESQTYLTLE